MRLKVAKFGGSSVADGIQISKIKNIVKGDEAIKYVVVSAPGKRFKEDSKITDLLYSCKMHAENNLPYEQIFQVICDRYNGMKLHLGVDIDLKEEFEEIQKNIEAGIDADYIASRGEYLNAKLISSYLEYDFIDTAGLIVFDEKGRFLEEETNEKLGNELQKHENAVLPGFYGSKPDGAIKTFSRGGSDITGAIVARAACANVYENWTDVSGFLVADPRIVENPEPINSISYKELRELSYMGASVLHEDAIYPAKINDIPINIRNTNRPEDPGTLITSEPSEESKKRVITGIAGSKDFTVLAIYKNQLSNERGFVRKLAGILEDYDIPMEHLPSGIDTLSVVMADDKLNGNIDNILEEFETQLRPDSMEVFDNVALIATVGAGMSFRPGVSAKLFTALADAGVNIRMIDQGSSEMNIIVGVSNVDFEKSIKAIYDAFIN